MELYFGTGGYSNDDWLGLIYPAETKSAKYLEVYAQYYNAVELNSSFYAIPGTRAFQGMLEKSEARVRFAIKAHQSITHTRDANDDIYQRLIESVEPLRTAGMLGPYLLQFPYSFQRTPNNRRYLKSVVDRLKGETLALEFRHQSWDSDEVRQACRELGVSIVSVDYPELTGLPRSGLFVTADIAYLRLHGRNKEKWWQGKNASERHDYRYTPDELRPWVESILLQEAELSQVYFFMQNTTQGHALFNLRMLKELFNERGYEVAIGW